MGLNLRQSRFVAEYALDENASEAAKRAGYSPKTAYSIGQRLLKSVEIQEAIHRLKQAHVVRTEITAQKVIDELALLAFSNMQDYMRFTKDGDPYLDFSKLTRAQAAALTEVTVEDYVEGRGEDARQVKKVKFKLADKRSALVDLGKHLGLFKDDDNKASGGNLNITIIEELVVNPQTPAVIESPNGNGKYHEAIPDLPDSTSLH